MSYRKKSTNKKKTPFTTFCTITPSSINPQKHSCRKTKQHLIPQTPTHRRAAFTYTGKGTTFITNIFRRAKLKIAFRANNTIHSLLMQKKKKKTRNQTKYASSGVCKLTYPYCKKAYVGHIGRRYLIRYNEQKHAFRSNSHTSKSAQHLIQHAHYFGTIHNTMKVLHYHTVTLTHLNDITFKLNTHPTTN